MNNIAVAGVSGRMGSIIAQQLLQSSDLHLVAALERIGSPTLGSKIANSAVVISDNLHGSEVDVLIDFTSPEGVMEHLDYCLQHNIAMVIGATGFTEQQLTYIKSAAQKIAIMQAYNMSIGVNVCYKLLDLAARLLDPSWIVTMTDVHHQHKKDAPSGTAISMAKVIANARAVDPAIINIHSERIGEVVGDHSVTFTHPDETIIITHHAQDRSIFANGAIAAARWMIGKAAGLYSMQDVISSRS